MAVDEEDKVFAIQRASPRLPLREEAGSIMRPECHDVRPTPTSASLPPSRLTIVFAIPNLRHQCHLKSTSNYKPTIIACHHIMLI